MTIKVGDFKEIEQLVTRRKYLLEFAECVDSSDYVQIIIRGKKRHFGFHDDARMSLQNRERSAQIKAVCLEDCTTQIAEIEAKLTAIGISVDA